MTIFLRRVPDYQGEARLYKLDKPVKYYSISDNLEKIEHKTEYVIISSVANAFCCETMAFPADEHGRVLNWGELAASRHDDFVGVLKMVEKGG